MHRWNHCIVQKKKKHKFNLTNWDSKKQINTKKQTTPHWIQTVVTRFSYCFSDRCHTVFPRICFLGTKIGHALDFVWWAQRDGCSEPAWLCERMCRDPAMKYLTGLATKHLIHKSFRNIHWKMGWFWFILFWFWTHSVWTLA